MNSKLQENFWRKQERKRVQEIKQNQILRAMPWTLKFYLTDPTIKSVFDLRSFPREYAKQWKTLLEIERDKVIGDIRIYQEKLQHEKQLLIERSWVLHQYDRTIPGNKDNPAIAEKFVEEPNLLQNPDCVQMERYQYSLQKKILHPFKRRSLEKKYKNTMYHVKEDYRQGKNNILKYQRKIERLQLEKERIISLLTLKWGDKSRGTFHFQPYNDEIDEVMENFFQQVKLCFKEVHTTR